METLGERVGTVLRRRAPLHDGSMGSASGNLTGGVGDDAASELANAPLHRQVRELQQILAANQVVQAILSEGPALELPGWYLGAGAVTGTVWNALHGFDPLHGIKDFDLVYFDPHDLSGSAEKAVEQRVSRHFRQLGVHVDVTNEARVHLWYRERFGRTIRPYRSAEHAISSWPTTASSIGVRDDADGFAVCAPFGMHDLFTLIVRPNKVIIDESVYRAKVARWRAQWPLLKIRSWTCVASETGTPKPKGERDRPVSG